MIELRVLGMKEIEQIKVFFAEVFTKEPWNDDWSDQNQLHAYIMDLIGNVNSLTLGLFDNDEMVGLSMGHIKHWYRGTEYCIDELCIKTEVQGKGYGKKFVGKIEEHLKSIGLKAIFLQTDENAPAYHFYKKMGFLELKGHVSFVKDVE